MCVQLVPLASLTFALFTLPDITNYFISSSLLESHIPPVYDYYTQT